MFLVSTCLAFLVALAEPVGRRRSRDPWTPAGGLRTFVTSLVQFVFLTMAGITWERWIVSHSAFRLTRATGLSAGALLTVALAPLSPLRVLWSGGAGM